MIYYASKNDSLVETMKIQANKYLMEKIAKGQQEVDSCKLQSHELIDQDEWNK